MDTMEIKVVLEPQKEGGYTVCVPALPGCVSEGESRKEAIENIKEAIALYLDSSLDETLPMDGEIYQIAV